MKNTLLIKQQLWKKMLNHLRQQGMGTRESGAFLLGSISGNQRIVSGFLPYEQLQSDALHNDYVTLNSTSFTKLWGVCRNNNVSVVSDIHTHRLGPQQSRSDRANPMIARKGHMAIIVPRFAQGNIKPTELGLHFYKGAHKWESLFEIKINQYFKIEK